MQYSINECSQLKIIQFKKALKPSLVFIIAILVRFLTWQSIGWEAGKVQSGLVEIYQLMAKYILEDGYLSLLDAQARVANPDLLGHPPGYSILISLILSFTSNPNTTIQFVSILFDAFSAVVIFLIARKLFSETTALTAGLLAAFSHQFAVNSVFLLPDTLTVFPILLAVYFFICSYKKQRILPIILCGICLGASCWLRGNLLLSPIYFVAAANLLFNKSNKLICATLTISFVITIAPITIRNIIVFGEFIPISLGAGQTLFEGIGDYDTQQKFGIPKTDLEICRQEARKYNRPDFANTLFGKDGIWRDRMRISQGWLFIKENPIWFSKIMLQRAVWMLKMEKVPRLSTEIPVTHASSARQAFEIIWENNGLEIARKGSLISPEATVLISDNNLLLQTDNSKYDAQFSTEPIFVNKDREYLAEINLYIQKGRVSVKAIGIKSGKTYYATDTEYDEYKRLAGQSFETIQIPFVPEQNEGVKLLFSNETPNPPTSSLEISQINVFDIGAASFTWTRSFRFIINCVQRLITTNIILPAAILGFCILIKQKRWDALTLLLIIPMYYFCVQSILHTEYRYVMAIHYFFFISTAFTIVSLISFLWHKFIHVVKKNKTLFMNYI